MTVTYEAIATTTLGSATGTISFTSIPQTYTDLVLVTYIRAASSGTLTFRWGNNSYDSGSNYSRTTLYGRSTSNTADSERGSNQTRGAINPNTSLPSAANTFGATISHFMNYSNTTTYKTFISRSAGVGATSYAGTEAAVGLWRSTSAINQIQLDFNSGSDNIEAGTMATLYGIKAE